MASLCAATDTMVAIPTVLVLSDPNLNRLGKRQSETHGATTSANVESELRTLVKELDVVVDCHQSNYESQLTEWVHGAASCGWPVITNPGGLTYASVVLRDALAEIADGADFRKVHISNIHAREESRHHSYLPTLAAGVIIGCGTDGYSMALRRVSTTL